MSLLLWKEFAKGKTELDNKINFVHDTILRKDLAEKTSQESFQKVFQPIKSKLDDVILSNLKLSVKRRPASKKGEVPDYGIDIEDEVPNYGLDDLFGHQVLSENEKQIVPKPPTYVDSLKGVLEGKKQIYVDPQYFPEEPQDLPPKYDENEEIDYALGEKDESNIILDDLELPNYNDVDMRLEEPEMNKTKTKNYLNKIVKDAKKERQRIRGFKSQVSQAYNKEKITKAGKELQYAMYNNQNHVLKEYIEHYEKKTEHNKGFWNKNKKRCKCGVFQRSKSTPQGIRVDSWRNISRKYLN